MECVSPKCLKNSSSYFYVKSASSWDGPLFPCTPINITPQHYLLWQREFLSMCTVGPIR
jgi:hypothetical protein